MFTSYNLLFDKALFCYEVKNMSFITRLNKSQQAHKVQLRQQATIIEHTDGSWWRSYQMLINLIFSGFTILTMYWNSQHEMINLCNLTRQTTDQSLFLSLSLLVHYYWKIDPSILIFKFSTKYYDNLIN